MLRNPKLRGAEDPTLNFVVHLEAFMNDLPRASSIVASKVGDILKYEQRRFMEVEDVKYFEKMIAVRRII
jgi:hypothetical protein